jgi:hypothetical protein
VVYFLVVGVLLEPVLPHVVERLLLLVHLSKGLYKVLVWQVRDANVLLGKEACAVVQLLFLLLTRDFHTCTCRLLHRMFLCCGF